MAANAPAPSSGPRYAPHDPTLPKPWKGLVDGNTGYLYFWNPDTNVTQYERPDAGLLPGPPPLPKHFLLSSSVQVHQLPPGHSSHDHPQKQHPREDDKDGRKADSRSLSRNPQNDSRGISHAASVQNGSVGSSGHKGSSLRDPESDTTHSLRLSAESYRRQHEITVSGKDVPAPFTTFEATGFSSEILKEVHRAGFSTPTPIQAQTWPIALLGRDIVGIAKTGSGKTLGYLFPGFVHLKQLQNNNRVGPTVLVLSPTRELATQINEEAVKFGRSSRISCTCLYGGAPKGPQLRDLDRGVDVVVATPGRLNDILEMRRISLRQVSYLVLDEADRMLDMGFEPQIRKIVKEIPTRRQTLMYTATWPKEVRNIASDLLVNPVQVYIGGIDELVANKAITQNIEVLAPMDKQHRLEQILRSQEPDAKVIIFCTTKRMCDQLARSIDRQFGAVAIHGDKSQSERDWVLNQFRTGRAPILVATDVAARGLDIKDIRVVVNYDFPTGVEDYVHRIGRTGRAGATGVAYTFFCDQDAKYASDLIKVLEKADQDVPEKLYDLAGRGGQGRGRFRRYRGPGGSRDRSRFNGDKRDDSLYGGKGSRTNLTSSGGWSERRHNERESPGRYSRGGGHEADLRGSGRHDNPRQTGEKLSGRIRSPSPNRRHASKSRSRSRSHSGGFVSRSRSRSHERSWKQGRKGSRSVDRMGVDERHVARKYSPVGRSDAASPSPYQQAGKDLLHSEKQSRSPAGDDTRNFKDDSRARLSNYPLEEEEEGMIRSDD